MFRTKIFLTFAIILLPVLLTLGVLGLTNRTHLIQDNWKVIRAMITLSTQPTSLSATLMAGEGFYGLGKYQRAAEYYLTATTLNPAADMAWNSLGNAYRQLSLYNEAESAYKQAIELDADTPVYYLNLADLYKRLPALEGSRDKQIVATLEAGLKATDNHEILLSAIVDYYEQTGDTKTADKYREMIKTSENPEEL